MLSKFNYELETPEERVQYLITLCENNTHINSKLLEYMGNYVLFALKDKIKGEIHLETKNNTFRRKKEESLDEKMDDPMFDKTQFHEIHRSIYNKPKDPIRQDEIAAIAPLSDMVNAIAYFTAYLDAQEAKSLPEGIKPLTSLERYRLKHFIIDLQKEQYQIREMFAPRLSPFIGPQSYKKEQDLYYTQECASAEAIDLTNSAHVYLLLRSYGEMRQLTWDRLSSDLRYVLMDLETIIDKVRMSPDRWHIFLRKIDKATNNTITDELREIFDKAYDYNYISRIWRHEICQTIANQAAEDYEEWVHRNNPNAWRTCVTCKTKKLLKPENFSENPSMPQGFAFKCRLCEGQKKLKKESAKISLKKYLTLYNSESKIV